MHFTMSMHLCNDNIAAVKWSAGGAKANCGMHMENTPADGIPVFYSDCCHNTSLIYSVDDYNASTNFSLQKISPLVSFLFILPVSTPAIQSKKISIYRKLIFPEKDLLAGSVPIEGLSSFRI